MIWITALLAAGLVASPITVIALMNRHYRFQAEQNQLLVAALMATKNTPFAASAASYVAQPVGEPEDQLGEVPMDPNPVIPRGTKLLGMG